MRGEPPAEAIYEAVHVKENGRWKLWRVREAYLPGASSHYEQLKKLAWLLGEWSSRDQAATVRNECEWTRDKNFLTRSFGVAVDGRIEIEGRQYIGWDASWQQIRSGLSTARAAWNKPSGAVMATVGSSI